MALENEQAAEAVEQTNESAEVAEQFQEADQQADPSPPLSVEEIAARGGWVPQDKFRGPAEKWKPADQFLLDGHEIKDRVSRELKGLRETVDTIKATNSQIMMDKLAQQHAELTRRYAVAVEQGDPDAAWRASEGIRALQSQATSAASPRPAPPAPETESWVQRNSRVQRDPVAWQRALAICDSYARAYPNSSPAEQLQYTEQHLQREYPHLFDNKGPANVNAPGSRSTASTPRGKTVADMPKEARETAKDLVERGMIPNEEAYAKHYFEMLAKRGVTQ
jgi:hypothetical protein